MPTPANLTTIVIIIASSFVLLLFGIVLTYFWLIKKYLNLSHQEASLRLAKHQEAQKIVEEAQINAAKLLEEARRKAGEILTNSQITARTDSEYLGQALQKATQEHAVAYRQALKDTSDKLNNILLNISNDIKNETKLEINQFRNVLNQDILKLNGEIKEKVAEVYSDVEAQIADYKKDRIAKLDSSIVKIVEELTKRVVGKILTPDEHEKLILKALEEAKKQGFF